MNEPNKKKAIVVGASSGIGRALAKQLVANGFAVGLAARRLPELTTLQNELGTQALIKQIDVSDISTVSTLLNELIEQLGGVDLIINSAGTGYLNPELDWEKEAETIAVNVQGFAAVAQVAMTHFLRRRSGHLVNISSLAAIRGSGIAPAYSASKAFESVYMDGLRQKVKQSRMAITVTDIQPGFVDTAMAKGEHLFWVASPEKAGRQIYHAIKAKKEHAYVTKRWRLFAWFLKLAPNWFYDRVAG